MTSTLPTSMLQLYLTVVLVVVTPPFSGSVPWLSGSMPWAFSTHQRFLALVIAGLNREVFCGTTATGS